MLQYLVGLMMVYTFLYHFANRILFQFFFVFLLFFFFLLYHIIIFIHIFTFISDNFNNTLTLTQTETHLIKNFKFLWQKVYVFPCIISKLHKLGKSVCVFCFVCINIDILLHKYIIFGCVLCSFFDDFIHEVCVCKMMIMMMRKIE